MHLYLVVYYLLCSTYTLIHMYLYLVVYLPTVFNIYTDTMDLQHSF